MSADPSPYASPQAPIEPTAQPARPGSLLAGVAVGTTVSFLASVFLGMALGVWFAMSQEVSITDPNFAAKMSRSTPFLASGLVAGLAGVFAGGYITATIARRPRKQAALWYIGTQLALGLLLAPLMAPYPLWYVAASWVTTPLAAYAGVAVQGGSEG